MMKAMGEYIIEPPGGAVKQVQNTKKERQALSNCIIHTHARARAHTLNALIQTTRIRKKIRCLSEGSKQHQLKHYLKRTNH